MELQYKQQPLHNNFMGASYAAGGLQGHTWEFQWGPQGLEQAVKSMGMGPVITQNFSTDPMGRILSMTYQGPTYDGELYFHFDVQGNTSLLTDSNGQAVASFRYDLYSGQLVESWNPSELEIMNLEAGAHKSIYLETPGRGGLVVGAKESPIKILNPILPWWMRTVCANYEPPRLLTYWEMLMLMYKMGTISQFPLDGNPTEPTHPQLFYGSMFSMGYLEFQEKSDSEAWFLWDPNRVSIHSGGGGGSRGGFGPTCREIYRNCITTCKEILDKAEKEMRDLISKYGFKIAHALGFAALWDAIIEGTPMSQIYNKIKKVIVPVMGRASPWLLFLTSLPFFIAHANYHSCTDRCSSEFIDCEYG